MNWRSRLFAAALALAVIIPAHGQEPRWFPPTPRSGLADEIGALNDAEATELRGMLREAVDRDDARVVVMVLKASPSVAPAELIKVALSRQKRCWFRGLICLSADSTGPPVVGYDGPGLADFPAERLQLPLAALQATPLREPGAGARILRSTADLLDEIHRQRVTHPPVPATWAGRAMAWAAHHPLLGTGLLLGAAALATAGLRAWRRQPSGLQFPAMPMPARLGGPYAGGSRVCVNFDAATVARSREHARR